MLQKDGKILKELERELKKQVADCLAKSIPNAPLSVPNGEVTKDFLTVKEFAFSVKVHSLTVYNWVRNKNIRFLQPGGKSGRILIPKSELTRLLVVKTDV